MEKIKYNISLDIQGIVPFRVEEGALEDLNNFMDFQNSIHC